MKNYIPLKKTMTIFFFPKHITYFFNQPKVKTYLLTTVNLHIISLQCVFSLVKDFYVYFGFKYLSGYVFCKYFLPACGF